MIKLIATDVDGTLGPVSTPTINPEYYTVMDELLNRGFHVAVASGRHYPALEALFSELGERLLYIADNGAQVRDKDQDIYISAMDLETSHELVRDVRKMNNGCECAYCVPGLAYFTEKDKNAYNILKAMHYKCEMVSSLEELDIPCIKMTVYHAEDAEGATAEYFTPKWSKRLQVSCSGRVYMDVMNKGTNKGTALKKVQEYLGVTKEETMVFGDNSNDIEMFEQAYYSYAVGDARKEVQEHARFLAAPMCEDGVLQELKKLLNQ